LTRGKLKVITTTAIKGISDGGSVDPCKIVSKALLSLIREHDIPIDDHHHHTEDDTSLSNNDNNPSSPPVQFDVARPTTSDMNVRPLPRSIDATNIDAVHKNSRKKTRIPQSP